MRSWPNVHFVDIIIIIFKLGLWEYDKAERLCIEQLNRNIT